MPHSWHFLIPDPASFPSGGNIYNARLLRALYDKQVHVSHTPFIPGVLYASPDTEYVVDSIYFSRTLTHDYRIPKESIGLIHHLESLYPLSSGVFEENERSLLREFKALLVTSPFTKDYLVGKGFTAERIHVIPPAPTMPKTDRKPSAKVRALMIGSLTPRKGQLAFLQALIQAQPEPFFSLTIAGNTDADPDYAQVCENLILSNALLRKTVRLTGEQDAEGIRSLYVKHNLFISAAAMETYGMAIQDAVQSGMPVLVLEGGYAGEHVREGVNGARHDDLDALASDFASLIADQEAFVHLQESALKFDPEYGNWEDRAALFLKEFDTFES